MGISNAYIGASSQIASGIVGWQLVQRQVISGGAVTNVTFSGLDLNSKKQYMLIYNISNTKAGTNTFYLFLNGDTNTGHYVYNYIMATGNVITGATGPAWTISAPAVSKYTIGNTMIMQPTGWNPRMYSFSGYDDNVTKVFTGTKTDATTNVTSITFNSADGAYIGNDSTLDLYVLV